MKISAIVPSIIFPLRFILIQEVKIKAYYNNKQHLQTNMVNSTAERGKTAFKKLATLHIAVQVSG
jgi:hypothetical protein